MSDAGFRPSSRLRWVTRRNRISDYDGSHYYSEFSTQVLQQFWVSDFVGVDSEWRDVPTEQEPK